ncbi:hypothetical protein GCM10022197_41810 [Microlunatus spumicola]|uniref:Uncharacterized protein n=2 Tax=Microlunatus spumicola TaxID=81499 RepID=A0ABP6YBI5_9ACTN
MQSPSRKAKLLDPDTLKFRTFVTNLGAGEENVLRVDLKNAEDLTYRGRLRVDVTRDDVAETVTVPTDRGDEFVRQGLGKGQALHLVVESMGQAFDCQGPQDSHSSCSGREVEKRLTQIWG